MMPVSQQSVHIWHRFTWCIIALTVALSTDHLCPTIRLVLPPPSLSPAVPQDHRSHFCLHIHFPGSSPSSYAFPVILASCLELIRQHFRRTPRICNCIFIYLYGCICLTTHICLTLTTLYRSKIPLRLIKNNKSKIKEHRADWSD